MFYLPDDSRCEVFYYCDWGSAIFFECPGGLYWNRELNVCDWPDVVNCELGGGVETTTSPPEEPIEETTQSETEVTTSQNLCPLENGDLVAFLPHEIDCAKFYYCDWGSLIESTCDEGKNY